MLDFPRWKITSILVLLAALMALAIPSFFSEDQTKAWGWIRIRGSTSASIWPAAAIFCSRPILPT